MYGFDSQGNPLSDEALIAEIAAYRKAIDRVARTGVGSVTGEGRRIEFTASSSNAAHDALRELLALARERGLPIGGTGGAIAVEIG